MEVFYAHFPSGIPLNVIEIMQQEYARKHKKKEESECKRNQEKEPFPNCNELPRRNPLPMACMGAENVFSVADRAMQTLFHSTSWWES